ncbi:hypothetical protein NA57DRAFT_68240 [Rhizodiscina lignyota]|uniref:Peptidase C45 hydrolase domain-containing protein n=1 Tax=Rhizodiscina lignyota TaxID=1504668 RepID=A0A9P4M343_9PEZI|nr:hypothetical protein NA57DRAFT_68240 [Rhizodiscina lignyota]
MPPQPNYQHIVVKGLPYDRGFSYGAQTKEKVQKCLAHYRQPGKLLPEDVSIRIIEDVYIPGIAEFFPEALPELRGIADGAGVSLNEIVLLNARYDLARIRGKSIRPFPQKRNAGEMGDLVAGNGLANSLATNDETDGCEDGADGVNECTSAGFLAECTANGDVILAQNWDMSANIFLNDTAVYLEIHPDPSEDLPIMFVMTEAGQLGRSGFNSAGLAVCASSLMSTEDYFPIDLAQAPGAAQEPVLPMSFIRRQFLHNSNFANALVNVKNAPRHCSNSLVVGTADSFVMALEITPTAAHLCYPEGKENFVVHANHFVSSSFHASKWTDRYPGGSSWFRAERVARKVRPHNDGGLTEKKIISAFSDHLSMPSSVCQHMEDSTVRNVPDYPYKGAQVTLAHLMYNLTQRTATVCKGPPCMGVFTKFEIPKTTNM